MRRISDLQAPKISLVLSETEIFLNAAPMFPGDTFSDLFAVPLERFGQIPSFPVPTSYPAPTTPAGRPAKAWATP
ncbi:hypothetical protein D9M68_793340 [compost metagenome]